MEVFHVLIEYCYAEDKEKFLADIRDPKKYSDHMVLPILRLEAQNEIETGVDRIDIIPYVNGAIKTIEDRHSSAYNILLKQLRFLLKDIIWAFFKLVPKPGAVIVFSLIFFLMSSLALTHTTVSIFIALVLLSPVIDSINTFFKAIALDIYVKQASVWLRATLNLDALFSIGSVNKFDIKKTNGEDWRDGELELLEAKFKASILCGGQGNESIKFNLATYRYSGPAELASMFAQ